MENHAQALFMVAMDKQFITKCITDHVENLVSSLTLSNECCLNEAASESLTYL